jgi:acyl dehydratase
MNPTEPTVVQLADLPGLVGKTLGPTAPLEITQDRVNLFADATGDHQWIHVDPERARAESPFGGPIAHGYLTLSLVNMFLPQLLEVQGASMGVNVGVDKVRFPSPVAVGAEVSATAEVVSVDEVKGGFQSVVRVTVTVVGATKPSCVVDTVSRFFP